MLQWFYNAKIVFLAVNASLRWLNNVTVVACRYLIQVSLLLIGQQGYADFFRYRPLLRIGWRILQFYAKARGKRLIQRHQPLLLQYKNQANSLLSMNIYIPLMIIRNYKNKKLTLFSQRKLAL
jgi:hypothetical protein